MQESLARFLLIAILFCAGSKPQSKDDLDSAPLVPCSERPSLATSINGPSELAFANGYLYAMESAGSRLIRIDPKGMTAMLLLPAPSDPYTKDPTLMALPFAIALTPKGELFLADVGGKLGKLDPNSHTAAVMRVNLKERFPQVHAMVSDAAGRIIIVDRHSVLRWTPSTDQLEELAGGPLPGFSGDNGPGKSARLHWPQGVAVNKHGDILLADTENCRIRKIDADTGILVTIAGDGQCQSMGDGGKASAAQVLNPRALAIDSQDNVFVSEGGGCRVRRIDAAGIITTYAGGAECGSSGDGQSAFAARVSVDGLALDPEGNLFIAEFSYNRIRRIDSNSHTISTIAGNGLPQRADEVL